VSGENQANSEAGSDKAPAGWVLFGFGFRPFFLMAGLFSVLATAAWLGVYFGPCPIGPARRRCGAACSPR
jgi:uncharacterized protein involved in response to NO